MAQIDDFLNALAYQVDVHHIYYSQGVGRCRPDHSGYADCSGFQGYGLAKVGLRPDLQCTGSFAQARAAHDAGLQIPVSKGMNTRGAWLFRGSHFGMGGVPGRDPGHVAVVWQPGVTIEARGHRAGVGRFPADSLTWDGAYLIPGMKYGSAVVTPPKPPPPPPKVKPMYNPSLHVVDTHVSHGYTTAGANGTWMLQPDGSIFTIAGKYWGGANTDPNFVGRVAEQLVAPGQNVDGANPAPANEAGAGYVYIVIAGSGERYGYPRGGGVK